MFCLVLLNTIIMTDFIDKPIRVCPELNNGKTLCDIWNLYWDNNINPTIRVNNLMAIEFALLLGFKDPKEQKNFEEGIIFLRKDLNSSVKP